MQNKLEFTNILADYKYSLDLREVNIDKLAWLGDAIYELYLRQALFKQAARSLRLHRLTIRYVNARFQAEFLRFLLAKEYLNLKEQELVKRARNFQTHSQAKNQDPIDYKMATAFEALLASLYLEGKNQRIFELLNMINEFVEQSTEFKQ